MTSLKESLRLRLEDTCSDEECAKWADEYIKELEVYMHSEHHYGDVEVAISNVLKFLRGMP